jgi:hypothetical protein
LWSKRLPKVVVRGTTKGASTRKEVKGELRRVVSTARTDRALRSRLEGAGGPPVLTSTGEKHREMRKRGRTEENEEGVREGGRLSKDLVKFCRNA